MSSAHSPILITGVGKRLGYELAHTLLDEGHSVIGTFRTHYPSIDELRQKGADLYQIDLYQQTEVEQFVTYVCGQYQSLRALIHNASDWLPDNAESLAQAATTMHKMMTIHVGVPYQLNLALQPLLNNAEHAFTDIIHISDYVAEKGSKKHIAYAASKTAMNSLTSSFAALMAPKVKVNSVSPALIKFNPEDDQAYKDKAYAKALLPKEAGFAEVVEGIKYILNSQFMTGRNLQLDGGRHLK